MSAFCLLFQIWTEPFQIVSYINTTYDCARCTHTDRYITAKNSAPCLFGTAACQGCSYVWLLLCSLFFATYSSCGKGLHRLTFRDPSSAAWVRDNDWHNVCRLVGPVPPPGRVTPLTFATPFYICTCQLLPPDCQNHVPCSSRDSIFVHFHRCLIIILLFAVPQR